MAYLWAGYYLPHTIYEDLDIYLKNTFAFYLMSAFSENM